MRRTLRNWSIMAVTLIFVAGCSDDETEADTGVDTGGDSDTGGDDDVADSGDDDSGDADDDMADTNPPDLGDVTPPTITGVTVTENPNSTLAAIVEFSTDEEADVAVAFNDESNSHVITVLGAEAGTTHELWILGLRADHSYSVEISATDAADNEVVLIQPDTFDTSPLPTDLPAMAFTVHDADRMQAGQTLMSLARFAPNGEATAQTPDGSWSYTLALDNDGEVAWYIQHDFRNGDISVFSDGRMFVEHDRRFFTEYDMMGNVVADYVATALLDEEDIPDGVIEVDTDSFHHEWREMPNGNALTLSSELRTYTDTDCPNWAEETSIDVVGDVIVEVDLTDGSIVNEWNLLDMLDACRLSEPLLSVGFWNGHYSAVASNTSDWSHANGVTYDVANNEIVVSVRHQDWVVAFAYADDGDISSGDLLWRMGPDGDLTLAGDDAEWNYHQHAPTITPSGDLAIFDNGNGREGTNLDPDDELGDADLSYSRAVIFSLDRTEETATQMWQYRDLERTEGSGEEAFDVWYLAPFVGDIDILDNGNITMHLGGLMTPHTLAVSDINSQHIVRLLEIDPEDNSLVMEFEIYDTADEPVGYMSYRSERLDLW